MDPESAARQGVWCVYVLPDPERYGIARARLAADWCGWMEAEQQAWRLPPIIQTAGGRVVRIVGGFEEAFSELQAMQRRGVTLSEFLPDGRR